MLKRLSPWLLALALPVGALFTAPAKAADFISLTYAPFQRSFPISELEEFVSTQEATGELRALMRLVPKDDQAKLIEFLGIRLPFNVVQVDAILASPIGKELLKQLSQIIIRPDTAGEVALRGALLSAAASPEGLSVISLLKNYPGETINLDLRKLNQMLKQQEGFMGLLGNFRP
ncbi:MAG: alpha/beta hydrolase [Thermosynechococcus sp. Uc]|uniref:alpha/beta hydrolase n=1 Tax=Thermosynechococcus sp. Uc TaxID=3034853 RepID=UPI001A1074DB|nr:alpha/beta hydrolase [Thermosynechococcus sp. Uc]MDM7326610.1 alpha/beta hydrolase [Thermosynechococcus sp. Uc]HIK24556.1 alpha/beta hydrolase [Thermosynechococcus sp. M46_R2017_013]